MRIPRVPFALLLTVMLVAGACASAGTGGGGSANVLTAADLEASGGEPLYDTLERIRPQWLVTRSGQPNPVVLIDGVQSGGMGTMRTLTSGSVEEIRYIRPEAAASRFGRGFEGGAFEITLKH